MNGHPKILWCVKCFTMKYLRRDFAKALYWISLKRDSFKVWMHYTIKKNLMSVIFGLFSSKKSNKMGWSSGHFSY